MSKTTAGNILGHAYAPGALTIAAADLCVDEGNNDAIQNYSDDSVCPTLSIAPYSADGEGAGVPRFYWQMDSESNWQQIDGGLAVAKPSVTALGKESVQLWDGNALAMEICIGPRLLWQQRLALRRCIGNIEAPQKQMSMFFLLRWPLHFKSL